MSRKLINKVNFTVNGAKFRTFIHHSEPKTRKKSNDYIEIEITSEEGEKGGWRMNGYDLMNIIWILSNAVLVLQERGFNMIPEQIEKEEVRKQVIKPNKV
jgi:hypothetical protein